jgi:hypothetical protein
MRRTLLGFILVAATTAIAPSFAAAWHAGEVVIGGYRLPRDHRFETRDASGKDHVVNINDVPSLIQQGRPVLDQTANVWIKHPNSTSPNAQYLASTPGSGDHRWDRIRGTVQSVNRHAVVVRTDDGRNVAVDMSQARLESSDGLKPGDRVVVGGTVDASNRVIARYVREVRDERRDAPDQGQWQRIHGRVQGVQGSTLRFRADDGRVLNVDMSDVSREVQRALTHNEGATVIGFPGSGNHFRAEYVQQDSSDPARGGRVTGHAPPPARVNAPSSGVHRIQGQITSIGGSMMDLRTDDGRTLVVDMGQLNPETVKSLNGGDRVTVTGLFRDSTRIDAQSVQK